MKKLILSIAVVLMIGFTVTSCKSEVKKETEEVKTEVKKEVGNKPADLKSMAVKTYQCPMKCEGDKTYDKSGQCPTCKMDLKEVKAEGETKEHNHEEGSEEHEG